MNCSDLEEVYTLFNVDPPEDFQGHSMSVSDVVVEGRTAFFCDSIGFRQVTFDESTARPLRREIHVVLLEPGKLARPASIDASLESYQKIVGGMIEAFYPFEEPVCIVCNEEGKLDGLTTIIESDDGHGNILEETVTETKTTLHIVVSHKTATEMAAEYGFGERQLEHLDALLGGRHLRNVGGCALRRVRCRRPDRAGGADAGRQRRRRALLVMVWLRQPCGMVCLLCFLVRRPVRLHRHRCHSQIRRLRQRRPVVPRPWPMGG